MRFIINHIIGIRDLIQSDTLTDMIVIPTARCKRLMLIKGFADENNDEGSN